MRVASRRTAFRVALSLGGALWFASSDASTIERLCERIALGNDGSARVERTIVEGQPAGSRLAIPIGVETLDEVTLAGCDTASATVSARDGVRQLLIERGEGCSLTAPLTVRTTVAFFYDWAGTKPAAFGNRTVGYRFVNTQPAVITHYECELVLPKGFVVSAVEECIPAPSEKNPVPPFQIVRVGDRNGVRLFAQNLAMGDEGLIRFKFKSGDKPALLFGGGLAVALAYLIWFRDLVRKPRDPRAGA
jgi:hypothetical protein